VINYYSKGKRVIVYPLYPGFLDYGQPWTQNYRVNMVWYGFLSLDSNLHYPVTLVIFTFIISAFIPHRPS
jgi:hypothetical protein